MLEISKLNVVLDGKKILNDINFIVEDGEILSIIGPSGCGKSTILKTILGIYQSSRGDIILDKKSIKNIPINERETTLVFQDYSLFPHMTVLQNMLVAGDDESEAEILLMEFELIKFSNKFPHELSGGEQQRIAIARALFYKPKLLLLDEPFSNIDAITTVEFRKKVKDYIERSNITTIIVTHDLDDVFDMSNRCMVMENSRTMQVDTIHNIFDYPSNDYVQKLFKQVKKCTNGNGYCKIISN